MEALTAAVEETNLPAPVAKRGISEEIWRTLCTSIHPGARSQSILMFWDYCKARKLDPLKKVAHIVPMYVRDAKSGNKEWRDVIMPGIADYRITAHRTKEYVGKSKPLFGPMIDFQGLKVPEWCEITVYRMKFGQTFGWTGHVRFVEAVGEEKDGGINRTWKKRPYGQLAKCAEAEALREAFPEEIGGEPTAEEMHGREIIEGEAEPVTRSEPSTTAELASRDRLAELREHLKDKMAYATPATAELVPQGGNADE